MNQTNAKRIRRSTNTVVKSVLNTKPRKRDAIIRDSRTGNQEVSPSMRTERELMLAELSKLEPANDRTYDVNRAHYSPNPPQSGSIRRALYDLTVRRDGATLDEMYDAARASGRNGWSTFRHWDGPDNDSSWGKGNGIGLLRLYGDLRYFAATRKWHLELK